MLKIEQFAKEHFNIQLTSYQLELIAMLAAGNMGGLMMSGRQAGRTTATKVAMAYLQDGMKKVKI